MQRITKTVVAFSLTFGLGAVSAARADDTFADAHDDAPVARIAQDPSRLAVALAPDAHDDSDVSARSFQLPHDAATASGDAIATSDAYDDAGITAPDVGPHARSGA